jgi:tetratricopeptide (TPR) repeat protein
LLDTQKLAEAKSLYKSINSSDIEPSVVAGIEGRIALLDGDLPLAIENLSKFYQEFPSSQNALMLAHAYRSNSNSEKAIETLEGFKSKNDDLRVSNVLANLYLGTDVKKAAAVYKEIVEKQPANSIALNNLAWLAKEDGDYDKALTYADRALELSPSVVNIIDTRAMILFAKGERVKALNELARAFDLSKGDNPEITMNYIDVLIANKRKNKAKQVLANIKNVPERLTERFVSLNKKLQ